MPQAGPVVQDSPMSFYEAALPQKDGGPKQALKDLHGILLDLSHAPHTDGRRATPYSAFSPLQS